MPTFLFSAENTKLGEILQYDVQYWKFDSPAQTEQEELIIGLGDSHFRSGQTGHFLLPTRDIYPAHLDEVHGPPPFPTSLLLG